MGASACLLDVAKRRESIVFRCRFVGRVFSFCWHVYQDRYWMSHWVPSYRYIDFEKPNNYIVLLEKHTSFGFIQQSTSFLHKCPQSMMSLHCTPGFNRGFISLYSNFVLQRHILKKKGPNWNYFEKGGVALRLFLLIGTVELIDAYLVHTYSLQCMSSSSEEDTMRYLILRLHQFSDGMYAAMTRPSLML